MNSVLAVFAKVPLPGKVKTRLAPQLTPLQSAGLYRCMLLDTIAKARLLPDDVVIFYEGEEDFFRENFPDLRLIQQHPAGLGERLEAAFDELAVLGYRERVVIGTDAPDIPLDYLRQAFLHLAAGSDAVFGPAEDGGYYLVGVRGKSEGLFREVPWSGPQVLAVSLQNAEQAGMQAQLLPTWYDVDSYEDLLRPGLLDASNGAPLTRDFLGALLTSLTTGSVTQLPRSS
jgi:rSAM/selenodomain-associated transferase 1